MAWKVLLLSDGGDRQTRGLASALRRRGCETWSTSLASIRFDTTLPSGLSIPGSAGRLPDAVLVRSISAGSFEAVTRRLGVLHALARLSVPVWNSAAAIERCVDKSMTSFLLQRAGVPTPETFVVEGRAEARAVAERELIAGPLVLKPLFGAQGRGIRLIRAATDLPEPDQVDGVYYLQRHLPRPGPPFRDYRVFVCAGRVVAMMVRRGDDWITNINRGAVPEMVSADMETSLGALAVAAAAAVGADFAGVDLMERSPGDICVLEVNSMPAWSGLQSVTRISIAGRIATELVDLLAAEASGAGRREPRAATGAGA